MGKWDKTHDLDTMNKLVDVVKASIDRTMDGLKFHRSWFLFLLIGFAKISMAAMLMGLYLWPVPWSRKFNYCLFGLIITLVTYTIDIILPWFWWPGFYAAFTAPNQPSVVVCIGTPFFAGTIRLKLFNCESVKLWKRLPTVADGDETWEIAEFFTTSGHFLDGKFNDKFRAFVCKSRNDVLPR
jgi:hypothetical protein